MSEVEKNEDYQPQNPKRTRKVKAAAQVITNRSTRRGRRFSEEEYSLPQKIPRNQFDELECKQSFETQTTKLILQIPMSIIAKDNFVLQTSTRVESIPLQIQIKFEKDALTCSLKVQEEVDLGQQEGVGINIYGKCSWLSEPTVITKSLKSMRKVVGKEDWQQLTMIIIKNVLSDCFICLNLRKEEQICDDHLGLVNQGNTCYMNSYLQMLFHLPEFRKLIFSAVVKEPDRFPATLQMLFYRLLNEQKAVSPQELIKSFGWSKKDAQVQQDVQEFSCLFFDILQRKVQVPEPIGLVASIGELFCGELTHYIQCSHVGTNKERFFDIHVPLMPSLSLSLDVYVEAQELTQEGNNDNRYSTDYYGLQDAKKGLLISKLPPVLMVELKRFQYNYNTESNEKMLGECKYPEQMDFAKWTTDPHTSKFYQLYSVLVHEGSHANSGHYYVFIKDDNQWVKFNDQRVEVASREKALHYNYGGESNALEYNPKEMSINLKKHQNKATAYMLVYVNKEMAGSLFDTGDYEKMIPEWLIDRTREKKEQEEQKKLKKQFFNDIPVIRWSRQLMGAEASGMGMIPLEMIENAEERIQSVAKNMRVEQWLKELKGDKEDQSVYLYYIFQEKEVLICMQSRGSQSVKDLLKEVPNPVIIFIPQQIKREQFLVVIKEFRKGRGDKAELIYAGSSIVQKSDKKSQIFNKMANLYQKDSDNWYYLQEKKDKVVKLNSDDKAILPIASPAKNQLLIIVVQILRRGDVGGFLRKFYQKQIDTIKIAIYNLDNRDEVWEREINRNETVEELRRVIFEDLITEKEEYQSSDNIIIMSRERKGRQLVECDASQKLKEITQAQKNIFFSYSALDITERKTLKELTFFYRRPNSLILSDIQTIVIEKDLKGSVIDLIYASSIIKEQLPHRTKHQYRMFFLSKQKNFIQSIVDEKGQVSNKKGDLQSVLERQKNWALVIQEHQIVQKEGLINILIHHVAKTGEKMGMPRWEYSNGSVLLSTLKYHLLEAIQKDQVDFEGRFYQVNPIKVRLLAFVKDWSRSEELPEPSELMNEQGAGEQTIQSRYGEVRTLRVGVVHSGVSKQMKALKLNVEWQV